MKNVKRGIFCILLVTYLFIVTSTEEVIYRSILPIEKCISEQALHVQETQFMGIKTKIIEYKTSLKKNTVINLYRQLYGENLIQLPDQKDIFQLQIQSKNYIIHLTQEKKFTTVKIIQMNNTSVPALHSRTLRHTRSDGVKSDHQRRSRVTDDFSNGFSDIPKFPNSTFQGYTKQLDGSIVTFYQSNSSVEEHKRYFETTLYNFGWEINNEIQKLIPESISSNFLCRTKLNLYCVIQFYSDEKGYTTTVIVRGKINLLSFSEQKERQAKKKSY
ncbi:MAG: hypothetical protein QME68_07140 [Elusimicrobiota bacterium]|nr:hypothetical protein [Elusimicrobiota bacterium]